MFQTLSSKIQNDVTISSVAQSSQEPPTLASESPNSSKLKKTHLLIRRRKLKSTLYFTCWPVILATLILLILSSSVDALAATTTNNKSALNQRRHEWIGKSVQYYSTVMRKNSGDKHGTLQETSTSKPTLEPFDPNFVELATKHYHARFLIKKGKWSSAEKLYRRIINELSEEEQCDNTKLAVSTLLLALHMQRTGDVKATRAVFLEFFRRVALVDQEEVHCTCSAKVLQAYALFEMKNGHSAKSYEIIQRAVRMDEGLSPVLAWKQFRDAAAGRPYRPTFSFRKSDNDFKP